MKKKSKTSYDPKFDKKIKETRPDWFADMVENHADILAATTSYCDELLNQLLLAKAALQDVSESTDLGYCRILAKETLEKLDVDEEMEWFDAEEVFGPVPTEGEIHLYSEVPTPVPAECAHINQQVALAGSANGGPALKPCEICKQEVNTYYGLPVETPNDPRKYLCITCYNNGLLLAAQAGTQIRKDLEWRNSQKK